MKKYIDKIEKMREELKKEFSVNREFAILQTKLEDLEIYFKAYSGNLTRRGESE
jgi:hypothetical protein